MKQLVRRSKTIIASLDHFMTYYGLIRLRPYQLEAAQAVLRSVLNNDGDTFVWKFARQGGKDETLAALYQYLMLLYCHKDISIIAAAPTFSPQTEIAMRRLTDRLSQNIVLKKEWGRQLGYIFRLRRARTLFLSADPSANVVGATAWPLLVINEAQDVLPAVYDKRFAPMAAAHNATRLFSGTSWTSNTLLAREERACRRLEEQDAKRRIFIVDGPDIARVHPPYGRFLESEMTRLGANHPIVISQYLCREIDSQSSMFNSARRALIFSTPYPSRLASEPPASIADPGDQCRRDAHQQSTTNNPVAFLIDVAGMDESLGNVQASELQASIANFGDVSRRSGRDSTTLSIVEIDLSLLSTLQAPIYRIVVRLQWTGLRHSVVFGKLKALADQWRPQHIVVDATGVGEGLWDMLDKAFPTKVIPVKFSQQVKSEIGYRFLAIIETGRFRDETPAADVDKQYAACQSEILIGPQKTMRWGVPDGTRDENGELIHDDIITADSLVAKLDQLEWTIHSPTLIVPAKDPLESMSHFS